MLQRKRKKASKLSRLLEIPNEVSGNEPKVVITGFNELIIENYKGILEYEDFYVRVNTYIGIININGFNLELKQMSDEAVCVKGKIESIDIETNMEEEER